MTHRGSIFRQLVAGLVAGAAVPAAIAAAPEPGTDEHFNQLVRPILESTCVHCHNADEQKGDGRLDTLEHMLKGNDDGAWLVPGKPEESKLYTSTLKPAADDMVMPPSKEPALAKNQQEVLKAWITAGAKWPAAVTALAVEPRIQFIRDIQPILEQNCVTCHNPDKDKGGLVMTTLESTLKGGDGDPALVPFDAAKSTLYTLTTLASDHDDLMPPAKSGGPLSKESIEKLGRWIKQGAAWPEGVVLVPKAKQEERPPSPDNLELVKKIRAFIEETSAKEAAEADMKAYTDTAPKTGKKFDMVPIPSGEFLLGSPEGEKDRKADEGPQVKTKIAPFWMGANEVTWELYMPFMVTADARWKDGTKKTLVPDAPPVDATSSPTPPYTDMTFGMGQDGFPAISMTEHAASKFCQWLSAQTGHFYRLPTEAEWEYAARAGTTTTWFFGDDASKLGEYAWYFDNSDGQTKPVRKKKPNPWGLYDIYGNVLEWTADQYEADWYAKLAGQGPLVENPYAVPAVLYPKSARGGSWDDDAKDLRTAARRASNENWKVLDPQLPKSIWYHTSAQFLGFRLVRPLTLPSAEEMHRYWNLGVEKKK